MQQLSSKKSDDLFEKSTMTFGEHLEELRKALGKALVWLGIGMGISLFYAHNIIMYVQKPLESSLENFYFEKAEREWEKANGVTMNQSLKDFMRKERRTPEIVFMESQEQIVDTGTATATTEQAAQLPNNFDSSLLRPKRIWRRITTNTDALQVTEPFMIYIKAGLVAGLVLASPGIFWHIWGFVSAGLYPHERRYVYFFLPASVLLFIAGAALAFFGVFQIVLDFLLGFSASIGTDPNPRLTDYLSLALLMPIGFGIAFQLPLVMLILERIGICTIHMYLAQWRWALLIIAFVSMVLTPGDITPMIAMMIPLIGLYFLGIGMCKYLPRGTSLGSGGYDAS